MYREGTERTKRTGRHILYCAVHRENTERDEVKEGRCLGGGGCRLRGVWGGGVEICWGGGGGAKCLLHVCECGGV